MLPASVQEVIDEELRKLSYLDQNAPEFRYLLEAMVMYTIHTANVLQCYP